ncbi:MAG: hypothetical protein JKY37_11545 [Nannocystaceae bacterium]|nr:hypothetical protein [Nannocystaceae bacterium]
MSSFDILSHRYQLNTIVDGHVTATHQGMHLLARPREGARLVMFERVSNKRLVTSRVVRVYNRPEVEGTFVETGNSVYLLERERLAAPVHPVAFDTTEKVAV